MQTSAPSLNPQPAGAQSSLGSLVHPVMGEYFFTFFLLTLQTSLGHLEHLVKVVYPLVSSSHFSSWMVSHSTTSSSTSCSSCLVQHSDSYSVLQISGPCTSQSLTRGVLHTFLLLLRLVVGYIGGVAPPVIGVVTLDNFIILSLLHHLDLVNAPLSISTRSCSSNSSKAHINTIRSLTVNTGLKVLAGGKAGNWCWSLSTIGIEGKGVE